MSSKAKIPKGKKPKASEAASTSVAVSPTSASAAHVSPKSGSAAARRSPSPKSRSAAAYRSPSPKSRSAAAHRSHSSTSASAEPHLASIATVTSLLARPGLDAYANVNEEALAKELAEYANMEEVFTTSASSASASAAARPPKTVKESLKSLAKTSKEVASLTAAAERSPSPEHFKRITESLAASTAIAADLTLIASIKAQLKSESKLGRMILEELEPYPISVQCHYITMFLIDLYATLEEPASTSLHTYIIGPKALPCTTKITEKQFLAYLIDIIGLPSVVGEKARGILFNKDLFNTSTIKKGDLRSNSIPDLIDYYYRRWMRFRNKKGGSRTKRQRRLNRTKKI